MGQMINATSEESSAVFVALRQFEINWYEAQHSINESKEKNKRRMKRKKGVIKSEKQ